MQDKNRNIQELKNILAGKPAKKDFRNEVQKALYEVNKQLSIKYLNPKSPDYFANKQGLNANRQHYQLTFERVKNMFCKEDIEDIERGQMPLETIVTYLTIEFEYNNI